MKTFDVLENLRIILRLEIKVIFSYQYNSHEQGPKSVSFKFPVNVQVRFSAESGHAISMKFSGVTSFKR